MYSLTEYSTNYSDTSGSSWQFKRDEIGDNENVSFDDSLYKYNLRRDAAADVKKKEM